MSTKPYIAMIAIAVALALASLWAQDGPLTSGANLRVRTDANGYLVASEQTYTAPDGPLRALANAQVRTDANGYLIITNPTPFGGGGGPTLILKSVIETVTSSTTLQDDDDFTFTATANTDYSLIIHAITDGPTLGDIKFNLTVPASTTGWMALNTDTSDTTSIDFATDLTHQLNSPGSHSISYLLALVRVAGTAGAVTLQWAQNASNASGTNVNVNSWMSYEALTFP